jgi:hypothetical protein
MKYKENINVILLLFHGVKSNNIFSKIDTINFIILRERI